MKMTSGQDGAGTFPLFLMLATLGLYQQDDANSHLYLLNYTLCRCHHQDKSAGH